MAWKEMPADRVRRDVGVQLDRMLFEPKRRHYVKVRNVLDLAGVVSDPMDHLLNHIWHMPESMFDGMPTDGAEQLDHYVYGVPKRVPADVLRVRLEALAASAAPRGVRA